MAVTNKKTTSAKSSPSRSKTAKSNQNTNKRGDSRNPVRRGVGAVICLLLAAFSFIGFADGDAVFIVFFRTAARGLIGSGFNVLPFLLIISAMILCFHRGRPVVLRVSSSIIMAVNIAALMHLFACKLVYEITPQLAGELWRDGQYGIHGGLIGGFFAVAFKLLFSASGAAIVFFIIGIFLLFGMWGRSLPDLFDIIKNRPRREYEPVEEPPTRKAKEPPPPAEKTPKPERRRKRPVNVDIPLADEPVSDPYMFHEPEEAAPVVLDIIPPATETVPQIMSDAYDTVKDDTGGDIVPDLPVFSAAQTKKRAAKEKPDEEPVISDEDVFNSSQNGDYTYPPLHLLSPVDRSARTDGAEEVRTNSELLANAFRDFNLDAKIVNATRGPSVTRYEAELGTGEKLASITRLTDDIALALGASGVRIAPMANKRSTVAVEVPNQVVTTVRLREIIESAEFQNSASRLTFAIGKNIPGEAIIGDISKLTHVLVAGTTGSGKSVCLNSLILSILYKSAPDEVRFIMIDPKMVEFRIYNGIPHLLVPVVTDIKKACGALQWAVVEMERRYKYFSERNSRDLATYNAALVRDGEKPLPQMVIVIDELADLMMTSGKEVEDSIIRIAQKGRASGIHLVLATQSPRKEVITGIMKANIPSKIALKVASALESRIILDASGAEKLVGNGDMLFAPNGTTKPVRVQGTWVTDQEREEIVEFIKSGGEAEYSDDIMNEIENAGSEAPRKNESEPNPEDDFDELLPKAAEVIFEVGRASTSMLQRRLRLGYARAARIIDQLEQLGFLGPFEGSKERQILVTREQWNRTRFGTGEASENGGIDDIEDDPPWEE